MSLLHTRISRSNFTKGKFKSVLKKGKKSQSQCEMLQTQFSASDAESKLMKEI